MGYAVVEGRRTFGVVFPIFKGTKLRVHGSNSEWSFSTNQIPVIGITTAQIESKWDGKLHRVELKFECNTGESEVIRSALPGFPLP